jgi:hypothetical protein
MILYMKNINTRDSVGHFGLLDRKRMLTGGGNSLCYCNLCSLFLCRRKPYDNHSGQKRHTATSPQRRKVSFLSHQFFTDVFGEDIRKISFPQFCHASRRKRFCRAYPCAAVRMPLRSIPDYENVVSIKHIYSHEYQKMFY